MRVIHHPVVRLNLLALFLVLILVVYARLAGPSASLLFRQPDFSPYLSDRLLTHTFQFLCAVPFITCAFSHSLLRLKQSSPALTRWIFWSAFLTGGFLLNEIFRLHIHLRLLGVPKLATVSVYALLALWYGLTFRRTIARTPYLPLLLGVGFLFTGIAMDALRLGNGGLAIFLEGVPKLLSELNIAFYFWKVCLGAVVQSTTAEGRSPS